MQQRDHGASGFPDDFRDQVEGVLRAEPETDEGDIRPLALGGGSNFLDVDLAGNHLVAEAGYDLRKQLEPIAPLVRDQDAKMLRLALDDMLSTPRRSQAHREDVRSSNFSHCQRDQQLHSMLISDEEDANLAHKWARSDRFQGACYVPE